MSGACLSFVSVMFELCTGACLRHDWCVCVCLRCGWLCLGNVCCVFVLGCAWGMFGLFGFGYAFVSETQ